MLFTSFTYFTNGIVHMFRVLSSASLMSLDETLFQLSFFATCLKPLYIFLNFVFCANENKSL